MSVVTRLRQTLRLVHRADGQSAGDYGASQSRQVNSNILGAADAMGCRCGPGRVASPRYTCVSCARFALYGRQLEERNAYRARGAWR